MAASLTRGSCPLRSCPGLSSLPCSLHPLWLAFVINVEQLKSLTWVEARQHYWSHILLSWTGHEQDAGSQGPGSCLSRRPHERCVCFLHRICVSSCESHSLSRFPTLSCSSLLRLTAAMHVLPLFALCDDIAQTPVWVMQVEVFSETGCFCRHFSYARSAGDYRVDVNAVGFCFSCVNEMMLWENSYWESQWTSSSEECGWRTHLFFCSAVVFGAWETVLGKGSGILLGIFLNSLPALSWNTPCLALERLHALKSTDSGYGGCLDDLLASWKEILFAREDTVRKECLRVMWPSEWDTTMVFACAVELLKTCLSLLTQYNYVAWGSTLAWWGRER